MTTIENIATYWWQLCIVIIVLTGAMITIFKGFEGTLKAIGGYFGTLKDDILLKSPARRANTTNNLILIFSFALALTLITPNALSQLGLIDAPPNRDSILLGAFLFIVPTLVCPIWLRSYENLAPSKYENQLPKPTPEIDTPESESNTGIETV
jgi:hypothetical protein